LKFLSILKVFAD